MSVDEQITQLAALYMQLIAHDHHKDRDCHWYVEKRWSYGEGPIYKDQHNGYCYADVESRDFSTYAEAAGALVEMLKDAVAQAKRWHDEEGGIPPMLLR